MPHLVGGHIPQHGGDGVTVQLVHGEIVPADHGQAVALQHAAGHVQHDAELHRQAALVVFDELTPQGLVTADGRRGGSGLFFYRPGRGGYVEHPAAFVLRFGGLVRQRRLIRQGRTVLPNRGGSGTGQRGLRRGWCGGGNAPLHRVLQGADAGHQSGHVAVQALVAQPQQTQLCVGALADAVRQGGGAALDGLGHIQQAAHGHVAPQVRQRLAVIYAAEKGCAALRRGLHHRHVPAQVAELAQQGGHVLAAAVQLVQQGQRVAALTAQQQPL